MQTPAWFANEHPARPTRARALLLAGGPAFNLKSDVLFCFVLFYSILFYFT